MKPMAPLTSDDIVENINNDSLFLIFEDNTTKQINKPIELRWAAFDLQEKKERVRVGVTLNNVTHISAPISGVKLQLIWYRAFMKGKV